MAVLKTEGLCKRYGSVVAVRDLSLEVYEGEVFGFLGPNGAGKTTSINMMCGLLRPDAGMVTVQGQAIADGDTDVRARVGVCPQEIVIWERLTCREQLVFVGQMYGLPTGQARRQADTLLYELDLVEKANAQGRTLSGGMKRRLNLAMALVHDPQIVVLDEPEAGLDPQSRVKVREFIQSLARRKTVILTTHNMDEADRVADRVAIIDHGELLVIDTPQALKQRVGTGDVIEIGLDMGGAASDSADFEEALQGMVQEARLEDEGRLLTVRALNAVGTLPAILDRVEGLGLKPVDVRVRENTLEDVFIQLTGRRLRE